MLTAVTGANGSTWCAISGVNGADLEASITNWNAD